MSEPILLLDDDCWLSSHRSTSAAEDSLEWAHVSDELKGAYFADGRELSPLVEHERVRLVPAPPGYWAYSLTQAVECFALAWLKEPGFLLDLAPGDLHRDLLDRLASAPVRRRRRRRH